MRRGPRHPGGVPTRSTSSRAASRSRSSTTTSGAPIGYAGLRRSSCRRRRGASPGARACGRARPRDPRSLTVLQSPRATNAPRRSSTCVGAAHSATVSREAERGERAHPDHPRRRPPRTLATPVSANAARPCPSGCRHPSGGGESDALPPRRRSDTHRDRARADRVHLDPAHRVGAEPPRERVERPGAGGAQRDGLDRGRRRLPRGLSPGCAPGGLRLRLERPGGAAGRRRERCRAVRPTTRRSSSGSSASSASGTASIRPTSTPPASRAARA